MQKYFLDKIDIFAYTPQMYIYKKEKLRTAFGGLMTFFTMLTFIGTFIYFGKDLFFKKNPTSIQQTEITNFPEENIINSETFNFAFGIQDGSNFIHFIDEEIYYPVIENAISEDKINPETGEMEKSWTFNYYTPVPCKQEYFTIEDSKNYFTDLNNLDQLYCIDPAELDKTPVVIGGDFVNEKFSYFTIKLYACQEKDGRVCKSQDEIDARLKSGYYALYFSEMIIDTQNYEKPFSYYGKDFAMSASNQLYSAGNLALQNIYIDTDQGILWSSKQTQRGKQVNDETLSTSDKKASGLFAYNRIRMKKFTQIRIDRTYTDIMQIAAQTGGIFKIVLLFFSLINYFYVEKIVNKNILDNIFNFSFKNDNNHQNDQNKQQSGEVCQLGKKVQDDIAKQSKFQNISQQLVCKMQQDQEMKDKIFRHQVKLSEQNLTVDQMKSMQNMIKIAKQRFRESLDQVTISKKMEEIEKLKMILLNKQQREVFEYLSTPIVFEEDIEKKPIQKQPIPQKTKNKKQVDEFIKQKNKNDQEKDQQKNMEHLYSSIKAVQQHNSSVSQRLFNLLQKQKLGIEIEDEEEIELQNYLDQNPSFSRIPNQQQNNLSPTKLYNNILDNTKTSINFQHEGKKSHLGRGNSTQLNTLSKRQSLQTPNDIDQIQDSASPLDDIQGRFLESQFKNQSIKQIQKQSQRRLKKLNTNSNLNSQNLLSQKKLTINASYLQNNSQLQLDDYQNYSTIQLTKINDNDMQADQKRQNENCSQNDISIPNTNDNRNRNYDIENNVDSDKNYHKDQNQQIYLDSNNLGKNNELLYSLNQYDQSISKYAFDGIFDNIPDDLQNLPQTSSIDKRINSVIASKRNLIN